MDEQTYTFPHTGCKINLSVEQDISMSPKIISKQLFFTTNQPYLNTHFIFFNSNKSLNSLFIFLIQVTELILCDALALSFSIKTIMKLIVIY